MAAESGGTELFGHLVSSLQDDIEVANGAITGELKYISTGALPDYWGPGYFLALKFTYDNATYTSVKVGLSPSEGSGLVELDADKNAVAKITNKDRQVFVVKAVKNGKNITERYDLSGLTFEAVPSA